MPQPTEHHVTYLNIGRHQWAYCDVCKLKWYVGSNLTSSWQDEDEADWAWNAALLAEYDTWTEESEECDACDDRVF